MEEKFFSYSPEKEKEKKEKNSSEEYAYSEILDKFIAYQPLKIDERVARMAEECGIELNWDDEGRVTDISFFEANILAKKMGITLLSPTEFWMAYDEALKMGDQKLIKQFESKNFTEWLDAIYEKDEDGNVYMTEHPEVIKKGEKFEYRGEKKKIDIPEERPGWFDPRNNIDHENIVPSKVDRKREKAAISWKYWPVYQTNTPVSPIRGYVTSSGTPSFDLDIPSGSKQPVLMLRECREELPDPVLSHELLDRSGEMIEIYLATLAFRPGMQNEEDLEKFYEERSKVLSFLRDSGGEFLKSQDKKVLEIREKMIDMLGLLRFMAEKKNDTGSLAEIKATAEDLFGIGREKADFASFGSFISASSSSVKECLEKKRKMVFVMGHKNPDTDTVVSSLFEAYRNHLIDKETEYIPVVQGQKIPDEVRKLVGDKIADSVLLSSAEDYQKAKTSAGSRWILVDQNMSDVQKFAISIIDHHSMPEKIKEQGIPKTWEMAGSTAALIFQKFHGLGADLDSEMARILYGAALMDTEDRSKSKMTSKDQLIMDNLKSISKTEDDKEFYRDLMNHLLNTSDAEILFGRDYKEEWGFGFSVAKLKGAFGEGGRELKGGLFKELEELADKNNRNNNFPLTIVKIVDYSDDNETVNRERFRMVFHEYASPELKLKMSELMDKIIRKELGGEVKIEDSQDTIDFWGTGKQLSRKKIAPLIEKVVDAFNEYYHSNSAGLDVKREFLKEDEEVRIAARELGIELSSDEEGRIKNISYPEAMLILRKLGFAAMSLPEYWLVLKEAKEKSDRRMIGHLQSPGFVEFLDTIILDKRHVINHPEIVKTESGYEFAGPIQEVDIPIACPGLFDPGDTDENSGFPNFVQEPGQYDNKKLWRYWSPGGEEKFPREELKIKKGEVYVPTRGHIFLLNQPALDTKIFVDDALPNLGIRPCSRKIEPPQVEIREEGDEIVVDNKTR